METFGQVLAAIIGPVIGILVGIFYIGIRNAKTKAKTVKEMEAMLDDVSYIQEMKHLHGIPFGARRMKSVSNTKKSAVI